MRIGFLISHPIQYYAPIFRELAKRCDRMIRLRSGHIDTSSAPHPYETVA